MIGFRWIIYKLTNIHTRPTCVPSLVTIGSKLRRTSTKDYSFNCGRKFWRSFWLNMAQIQIQCVCLYKTYMCTNFYDDGIKITPFILYQNLFYMEERLATSINGTFSIFIQKLYFWRPTNALLLVIIKSKL